MALVRRDLQVKIKLVGDTSGCYVTLDDDVLAGGNGDCVTLETHNGAGFEDRDELWTFKRKRFLKAVAKSLGVVIYEGASIAEVVGYYQ